MVAAACTTESTSDTAGSPSTTESSEAAGTDGQAQVSGFEVKEVAVGDRALLLAIADSPTLRAQGLMGVTDLGELDGMLFYWRHEASGGFWMKDTLIPLDIVWFDVDGNFVGRASMLPCSADPCETYSPGLDIDYRLAVEANPGDLDWISEDTVVVYSD